MPGVGPAACVSPGQVRSEGEALGVGPRAFETAAFRGSPNCGGYGLNFIFLTFSFLAFFPIPGSGKSGKTYNDHTVDVLVQEEERFQSPRENTG